MDPATATGLTLAILPLIISAIENYEYTFRPIVTYHRHRKEAKRFQNILRIQKTAFENECRLLLSTFTTHEDEMLNDRTSGLWRNWELDRKLAERLDESFVICVSTLELIDESLVDILRETGGFEDLLKTKVTRYFSYIIKLRRTSAQSRRKLAIYSGMQSTGASIKQYKHGVILLPRPVTRAEPERMTQNPNMLLN